MKNKVFTNFAWRFAERCGAQVVKLLVELALARILLPEDYGVIALITVIIQIMNVFVDSGLGNALIQKKNADDLDFSSVFYFNIVWCCILYVMLFSFSPFIASFYGNKKLSAVLRVLGLQIIISGVKNVQQAYVSKTMQFKRFFFATLGGTIGAAIIGILMAINGFGVWALVAQQLFNTLVDTVILWITVKWRPKRIFSLSRLKILLAYGWKLLASSLLDTFYNEIRQLIIGKFYSASDLAFYNRGKQFPQLVVNNVNISIDSVLLPSMSERQDDKQKVKDMTRKAIKVSTFIMSPLMMGMAFTAPTIIRLILTEKWITSVVFLRVFCITYMFYPIHTANLNAIKALGRSDLFLKLEIIKKSVGIIALILTMRISVKAMAYSLIVTSIISQLVNSYPNKELLNYSYKQQIKDILPYILLSIFMGICIYQINFLHLSDYIKLIIQVVVGALVYILGSIIFKIDSFTYLLNIIRKKRSD